jgi:pSer/pThr/pTyr-binding forkhead associated (FHA) protein
MKVKLVVLHGKPHGKALDFPAGEYLVGRGAECHIRPNSDWVSRQHCLLRVTGEALFIRDLASHNGTLVNGERLRGERRLVQGDQLQVGPLVFQVDLEGADPTPAAAPDTDQTAILSGDTAEMPVVAGKPSRRAPAEPAADPQPPSFVPPAS